MAACSRNLAVLAALLSGPAAAAGEGWLEHAPTALAKAQKEGKYLLIDFTGSDWCGWCIKLDEEVFDQDAFKTEAPRHFVLLKLDFPRGRRLSAELRKQNEEWRERYGVRGFPTVYLADAAGRPYARTGYRQGGAEAYLRHLLELRQRRSARDEALASAQAAEGAERARRLDRLLAQMEEGLVAEFFRGEAEQVVALDPDGGLGLRDRYVVLLLSAEVRGLLARKKHDPALRLIDGAFKKHRPEGELAQELHLLRGEVLLGRKQMPAARAEFKKALEAEPESARADQIRAALQKLF